MRKQMQFILNCHKKHTYKNGRDAGYNQIMHFKYLLQMFQHSVHKGGNV